MYGPVIHTSIEVAGHTVRLAAGGDPAADLVVVHLHRNEATAWAAAQQVAGVRVHSVAHGETRAMRWGGGWIDPNRAFSGHPLGDALVASWGLGSARGIIAAHNNETDGALSIARFAPSLPGQAARAEAGRGDPHALFWVTTSALYAGLAGENRVLQAADVDDDGSLSVWAARRGIPYVNVEARHGDVRENVRRLALAVELFG